MQPVMDRELEDAIRGRHRLAEEDRRDVFAKAEAFDLPDRARALGLYPFFHPIDRNEGTEAVVDGRRVLMFGSNNYLGLTTDPRVREAAAAAVQRHGTSLTGSRLLNGTLALHLELEEKLAVFLGKEACLVFTTGYQANLGVLQALVSKRAALVLDHRAHASLFDAAKLSDGETYTFRHADPAHLEHVLSKIDAEAGVLLALEGVFSMEGDIAPLPEYVDICADWDMALMVDDAHGVGVLGRPGRQ